jgi:hypothetical protein
MSAALTAFDQAAEQLLDADAEGRLPAILATLRRLFEAELTDVELQAWAERMKDALERIIEGLRDYVDEDGAALLSAQEVVKIARRALDPDEWTRVTE